MGIRARGGNDRLRTIWTQEMDRYFMDLLLEQVSRGNKFEDHLFSKRAWKHMALLFNAKFNFQYEKDVLKNRHKTLRNLYKAVKRLLDQKGFSWDENRQMVTADNEIWDDYIKIHPDARTYRKKTIPYFGDLCVIYGDATIEGKGEHVLEPLSKSVVENAIVVSQQKNVGDGAVETFQEITVDENFRIALSEGVVVDDSESKGVVDDAQQAAGDVAGNAASGRTRTYWQPPMDCYFIDLMLEQLQKGNQIDGVFRKHAWMDMIASFNAKFGFNYDVEVLKNRYKTLRRQYNVIKNLLELDGFAWDDGRQMVTADDYVWQDYIKTHTDARQFMTRPVPYYKDLCMICGGQSIVEGDFSYTQCLQVQDDDQEGKFPRPLQFSDTLVSCEGVEVGRVLKSAHTSSRLVMANHKNKRQFENGSRCADFKRSRGEDEGMASTPWEKVTAVSSSSDKRVDENSNSISIEKVIEAIQALPDMDEELILDACDLLEDEMKAKTFMALDVKLRKKWLLRKLRPVS